MKKRESRYVDDCQWNEKMFSLFCFNKNKNKWVREGDGGHRVWA